MILININFKLSRYLTPIIVSEYDQEIPLSQTAHNPTAPRGRATQPSQDNQEDKLSKTTSSLFPIKMIAILDGHKVTYKKHRTVTDSHYGSNNKQQNHHLRTDSSLSYRGEGGLNAFYWYQIFALNSAVVEVQEMFILQGSLLTNAMNHHGETF